MDSLKDFFLGNRFFDLENECRRRNINLQQACTIEFNPNGTARAFGSVARLTFQPNPDIAGIGIWYGLATVIFICAVGLAFCLRENIRQFAPSSRAQPPKPNILGQLIRNHVKLLAEAPGKRPRFWEIVFRILRALLISTADAQILTALAYGVYFAMEAKCSLSAYHYNVAVHTIIAALATSVLSVIMVRDYWTAPLAAMLRCGTVMSVFIFLGRVLLYQFRRGVAAEYMWTKRPGTDSALLLPISCFLDPHLNPFQGLSTNQINQIGGQADPHRSPELYLVFCLGVLFASALPTPLIAYMRGKAERSPPPPGRYIGLMLLAYKTSAVLTSSAIYCWCWGHIRVITGWVQASGWMDTGEHTTGNEEQDVNGIGQVLSIAIMAWTFVLAFGQLRPGGQDQLVN